MRSSIVVAFACAAFVSLPHAEAKPAKRAPAQFLGLDPHGPLARVRNGTVATPEDSACRTWGNGDGLWKALDRFGAVVGTARVTGMERYDVTNCDELVLDRASGEKGAGIFVRGSYGPLAIRPFQMTASARKSLEQLVAKRDARIPKAQSKKKDLPLSKRLLAFRVDGQAPRAVVGGRGLSVYRFERGAWILEHEDRPTDASCVWDVDMFRPLAAVDMNGDGAPEIVVHEAWVDAYEDMTLTPTKKGTWKTIESGIHGAFA